jgi:uncharacterized protein YegP (UPF0339 family)
MGIQSRLTIRSGKDDSLPSGRVEVARSKPQNDASSAHFDIYRSECVSVTSTLFAGGDWHWRLMSGAGLVLVDCGGYREQADASAAVEQLRNEAWSASVSRRA